MQKGTFIHFQAVSAVKSQRSLYLRLFSLFLLVIVSTGFISCGTKKADVVTVWTYDSFVSEWGPASPLAALYKEKTGTTVEFISKGDGGALLATLKSAGKKATADIIIGIDNQLASEAIATGLFAELKGFDLSSIDQKLLLDDKNRLIPYDFGHFAIIWDSESQTKRPESLSDLLLPEYRKKIIIMDPRTSTPGLGLVSWSQAVYGQGWKDFFVRLAPSILAMTPGWDTGYGLFTKGEAPLVLSYSTSPAYHKAYEGSTRFQTLIFPEGHVAQVEAAGVLVSSRKRKEAEKFLAFLLSAEAQSILPETQWMYPANSLTALPDSFSVVPPDIKLLQAGIFDPKNDPETAAALLVEAGR